MFQGLCEAISGHRGLILLLIIGYTRGTCDARYVCVSAKPAILYFNTEVHSSLRTIWQNPALSVYSMIATASQYSDLGLPTSKIRVFVAGKNWKMVGLLYLSTTSLSFTFKNDRRNSGGTLRQRVNLINYFTVPIKACLAH